MKTLEQLWTESGEKPGLKVFKNLWDDSYFVLVGRSPNGDFYGYYSSGDAGFYVYDDPSWSLYQEPKPRRLAWICKKTIPKSYIEVQYLVGDIRFSSEEPTYIDPMYWERAPWLDEPEEKKCP